MALFAKPIALTPATGGGMCVDPATLQPADIIVSTSRATISLGIRLGTSSPVSHAALYVGGGDVVEALGNGVTRWSLTQALADDALAVVYRSPGITPAVASRIAQFGISQVGLPYSARGALLSTDKMRCQVLKPTPGTFFCSQLVAEAYRRGGLALTQLPSQCVTPGDTVVIAEQQLQYAGHLRGDPSWFPRLSP